MTGFQAGRAQSRIFKSSVTAIDPRAFTEAADELALCGLLRLFVDCHLVTPVSPIVLSVSASAYCRSSISGLSFQHQGVAYLPRQMRRTRVGTRISQ
jgi:hypothetical protein